MPNPFQNIKFAEYQPTYVQQPTDQLAQTLTVLNQRYDEAYAMNDGLNQLLSDIKVDDPNKQHLANRLNIVRDNLKDVIAKGNFEQANKLIRDQVSGVTNDKALTTSIEHYQTRQAKKEELRKKYETGYFDKELYDDEIEKFNNYQGIGAPDDLGYYDSYNFQEGAKFVDIEEVIRKGFANYEGGDTKTTQNTSLEYSDVPATESTPGVTADVARFVGQPSAAKTTSRKVTDGTEAAAIAQTSILNNPDALAYIDRLVEIRNKKGIPTTREQILQGYLDNVQRKFGKVETVTATEEQAMNMGALLNEAKRREQIDDDLATPSTYTPMPAVGPTADDVTDLFPGAAGRFFGNLWNYTAAFTKASLENTSIGQMINWAATGETPDIGTVVIPLINPAYINTAIPNNRFRQSLANSWKSKEDFITANLEVMPQQDRQRIANGIALWGSDEDRIALENANDDIMQLDPKVIARAVGNIKNNPNIKDAFLQTNFTRNVTSVDRAIIQNEGADKLTFGGIQSTKFANYPVFDFSTGEYYNTYMDWYNELSDEEKSEDALKANASFHSKLAADNNLQLTTLSDAFHNAYVTTINGRNIAFGMENGLENASTKILIDSYMSRMSQRVKLQAKPYVANTPIKPVIIENAFNAGKTNIEVRPYTVGFGKQRKTYYVIHNLITGNYVGKTPMDNASTEQFYDSFEAAIRMLATKDKETALSYGDKSFYDYGDVLKQDNNTYKNSSN